MEFFSWKWIVQCKYDLRTNILAHKPYKITIRILHIYANEAPKYSFDTVITKFRINKIFPFFHWFKKMGIVYTFIFILAVIFNFIGKYSTQMCTKYNYEKVFKLSTQIKKWLGTKVSSSRLFCFEQLKHVFYTNIIIWL